MKKIVGLVTLVIIVSASFFNFQNFVIDDLDVNKGEAYVVDNFTSFDSSKNIWNLKTASCNQTPHKAGLSYPTLGQAIRSGECQIRNDQGSDNSYIRFITLPFDRRDAYSNPDYNDSVDHGKGGAETRANPSFQFNQRTKKGWDFLGKYYSVPGNKVRYSFDFRVYNSSILESKLASQTTIAQFHSIPGALKNSCGLYYPGSAPSPGLHFEKITDSAEKYKLSLSLKLFKEDIPPVFTTNDMKCNKQMPINETNPSLEKTICEVTIWSKTISAGEVIKKWLSVSFIINFDRPMGSFEFFFGDKSSSNSELSYQRQILNNGKGIIQPLAIKHNSCPSQIYLGNYVLGYNPYEYGYYKNIHATRDNFRKTSDFVHPNFIEKYGNFINGQAYNYEYPPMLVVDYDNFRIVQDIYNPPNDPSQK